MGENEPLLFYARCVPFYLASLKAELQPSARRSRFCALLPSLLLLFYLKERLLNEFSSHLLTTGLPAGGTSWLCHSGQAGMEGYHVSTHCRTQARLTPTCCRVPAVHSAPALSPACHGQCWETGWDLGLLASTGSCCFSQSWRSTSHPHPPQIYCYMLALNHTSYSGAIHACFAPVFEPALLL